MARIETDPNYSAPTFSRATAATDPFKKEDVETLAAAMSIHNHNGTGNGAVISYAANSVPGSAIQDGTVTTNKIADLTIGAGDIADTAVTTPKIYPHAVSTTGAKQAALGSTSTTSTSMVVIPGASLTLTTGGGELMVFVSIPVGGSTSLQNASFGIRLDGGGFASLGTITIDAAGGLAVFATSVHLGTPSAASHTIDLGWFTNAGTLTSQGTQQTQLVAIELKR